MPTNKQAEALKSVTSKLDEYHDARKEMLMAELRALETRHKSAKMRLELAADAKAAFIDIVAHCW